MSTTTDSPASTKDRLLDVTEELVAEHGFDAVSLRQITTDAGTNLAAVNYHFGSREALFREVFTRRVEPINQRRLALLNTLEANTPAGKPLPLEDVLDALFLPVVTIYRDSERRREVFFRFMGRCMGETDPDRTKFIAELFRTVVERFTDAFERALPGAHRADIELHFLFSVGVMAHTLCFFQQMPHYTGHECEKLTAEELAARMITYTAAGFRTLTPPRKK